MKLSSRYQSAIAGLVKATWILPAMLGLFVVIPLFLWSAWARSEQLLNSVLVTLFCLSFGWMFLSLILFSRSLKKLGYDGEAKLRLLSGPRPQEPDELRAWRLGWQWMCAVLAVILSMMAIPVFSWFSGK